MRTSLQQLHAPPRDDDRLRHARPGRGDDARPARRRHARRQDPAGRPAAAALRRPDQPLRRRVHRLAGDEPGRDVRRRRRGRRSAGFAIPLDRERRPRVRRGRPRDRRHPAGGVRGRRVRAARPAAARGAASRCSRSSAPTHTSSSTSTREPVVGRGRAVGRRRRTRRRCSRTSGGALFAARVDARTKARVGDTHPARRRSVAPLLLLAGDRREPASHRGLAHLLWLDERPR